MSVLRLSFCKWIDWFMAVHDDKMERIMPVSVNCDAERIGSLHKENACGLTDVCLL